MNAHKHGIRSNLAQVDAHVITPEEYEETTETNLSRAEFAITGVVQPHPRQQNHSPPQEVVVTLSLSQEVLSYFQAGGQGWQARVDGAQGVDCRILIGIGTLAPSRDCASHCSSNK